MKALIIKTSSMGDVIHTLPAISDAKSAIPNIEFDWVVEENFAEISSWHSAVKRVIPVALRRWRQEKSLSAITELKTFLKTLRIQKYDHIIDAQGFIKSALIALFAHGTKCGLDFKSARESIATIFYTRKFTVAKHQHAITRLRQLFAQTLGYEVKTPINYGIKSFFPVSEEKQKFLIFIHGASRPDKCWDNNKWIELARLAQNQGFAIKLPWGNEIEKERAELIAANTPQTQVLPKLKLYDLALIFLRSAGVVTIDTGLGHLAAALDVPTVSLYQNTDPLRIGTTSNHCVHVRNADHVTAESLIPLISKNIKF
jgi:heptosyltransferase-1